MNNTFTEKFLEQPTTPEYGSVTMPTTRKPFTFTVLIALATAYLNPSRRSMRFFSIITGAGGSRPRTKLPVVPIVVRHGTSAIANFAVCRLKTRFKEKKRED
jgi:hypothetical protein